MSSRPPRPRVTQPTQFGYSSFWVEYPSGLIDLTRTNSLSPVQSDNNDSPSSPAPLEPALDKDEQFDLPVDGDRVIRVQNKNTALVIIDMQNFFLHPDLRAHPNGLACVEPTLSVLEPLRAKGVKIVWVNWGLTPAELKTIPPSLARSFSRHSPNAATPSNTLTSTTTSSISTTTSSTTPSSGFGSPLPPPFGLLLMRNELNAALYGPLQTAYEEGAKRGTDVWIHKNRMSGLWGPQSALDLYLEEEGVTTVLFGGVNSDQCVLGTLVDSYYRGYDCILVSDLHATTSPEGGYENVMYNAGGSYGFTTDSKRIIQATSV